MNTRLPIRIGTAGWSVGKRYALTLPEGGSHLERYARAFSLVEIDTSFYRPHRRETYARWAASVGSDFSFAVKTPKALTHEGALVTGRSEALDRFLAEVDGLGRKLGALLVQLPPSLAFDPTNVSEFFEQLGRRLPPAVAIACEPRHESWSEDSVNTLLNTLGVSRVAVDPSRWETDGAPGGAGKLAYFRMHGSSKVYYSDYGAGRLEALTCDLVKASENGATVWCIFDNTAHGHAVGNAQSVQQMLTESTTARASSVRGCFCPADRLVPLRQDRR